MSSCEGSRPRSLHQPTWSARLVALCAMSRNKDTPATATFDHVSLTPGPPALAHAAPGVLFRSGTFLATKEIHGLTDNKLTYTRGGQSHTVTVKLTTRPSTPPA